MVRTESSCELNVTRGLPAGDPESGSSYLGPASCTPSGGCRIAPRAALVLSLLLSAAGLAAPQGAGSEVRIDYASARQEIQGFEAVVNGLLATTLSNSPFALVQKTKGVYLQGYGVTFTFLVNIHRAIMTPFGNIPRRERDTPEQKKRRIEDLKSRLVQALQDNGDSFKQLPKGECVTVVAFFEDRDFPDEENQNKTIVLSILKRDLEELAHREDRSREFRQRIRIVEY